MKKNWFVLIAISVLLVIFGSMTMACGESIDAWTAKDAQKAYESAGYQVKLVDTTETPIRGIPSTAIAVLEGVVKDETETVDSEEDENYKEQIGIVFFSNEADAKAFLESDSFKTTVAYNKEREIEILHGQKGNYVYIGTPNALLLLK